jgi:rsbT co-antagonist protein RsbR
MPTEYLARLLKNNEREILAEWVDTQLAADEMRADLINREQLRSQSREFIAALQQALQHAQSLNLDTPEWSSVRSYLDALSGERARQGFTATETALFIFSLKQPLFRLLRTDLEKKPQALAEELWSATLVLDKLGLHTTEAYLHSREQVIGRQQKELLELSTPVVELWNDVLAIPLVGTLDSSRAQVVMETLLQRIVETGAAIAIIDITGVPTVDTLVAQHLMKTIAAARLMGADCIISGIRPQIAQTIVHLGVDLGEVVTKATLADAFAAALERTRPRSEPTAPTR